MKVALEAARPSGSGTGTAYELRYLLGELESLKRSFDRHVRLAIGLSLSQARALARLAEGQVSSGQDLASMLGYGASRTSRLLQELESAHLIEFKRGTPDRRVALPVLTQQGEACAMKVAQVLTEAEQSILDNMSIDERRRLTGTLNRIALQLA